jgi:hypothetical protein
MRATATLFLIALMSLPLAAQGRRAGSQGVPPGQLPPAGQCRVWYEGRPPGQQPRATTCDDAERVASRSRNARVIYGREADTGWWGRDDDRRYPTARNGSRYPNNYPAGRGYAYNDAAYDKGYQDGYDKGREAERDNDRYDPTRESWYRSADRGYNNRYGDKDNYQDVYREGFRAGYDDGYRGLSEYGRNRRLNSSRFP